MCGISGLFNFDNREVNSDLLLAMTTCLKHRGPDAQGIWKDNNIGLGHARLSILDLSEQANQPMSSDDKLYTIAFNGEIYNFLEIRERLQKLGHKFRTQSDTEVIIASYREFGTDCFSKFNGMFSLAIYDTQKNKLVLARDPFGIKPLYYHQNASFFCFASEIKSLKCHPDISFTISNQAFSEYMWYGNSLGTNTIYNEVLELKPGTCKVIETDGVKDFEYFSVNKIDEIEISETEAIAKVKELLEASIKRHLISDVPVGIFLSGGIDSSAITAFASKHYKGKIKTYSVGFDFALNDELALARKIAEKYGTDHNEITINGGDVISIIESLVEAHDQPFGDAADIPLYMLTNRLKDEIKVVLQGDGGDEFFGGYSRYNTVTKRDFWTKFHALSTIMKKMSISNEKILRFIRFIDAISEKDSYKMNALLLTMESEYGNHMSVVSDEWKEKIKTTDPFLRYKEVYEDFDESLSITQKLFRTDVQIILKDTFFEKVDKSTMANSMEIRVPFVDKDLTQFMLSLPAEIKIKDGEQKHILKKALDGIVPDEVLYGKKKGFGVPYAEWLRTSLKEYFVEQISTEKVSAVFNIDDVRKKFKMHLEGKGNYGFLLWKVLIFSVWLNKNSIND